MGLISSTFFKSAFFIWRKNIGAKGLPKMLMKFALGENFDLSVSRKTKEKNFILCFAFFCNS